MQCLTAWTQIIYHKGKTIRHESRKLQMSLFSCEYVISYILNNLYTDNLLFSWSVHLNSFDMILIWLHIKNINNKILSGFLSNKILNRTYFEYHDKNTSNPGLLIEHIKNQYEYKIYNQIWFVNFMQKTIRTTTVTPSHI